MWRRKHCTGNCRHCQAFRRSLKRGLCWTCYRDTSVREMYPSRVRQGVRDFNGANVPIPAPTSAPPGSPKKVAVLEQRALEGQQLFSPMDAREEE